MIEPDPEILQIFREEAAERLDRIVDILVALESDRAEPGAVDSLFREAHTIKGSAGMIGLEEPRSIAHAMEDLLDEVRERGSFPPELTEPLLRTADALRQSIFGEEQSIFGEEKPEPPLRLVEPAPSPPAVQSRSATMRVASAKVDRLLDAVGETMLHHRRLEHALASGSHEADSEEVDEELDLGERLLGELQESVIQMRTLPLGSITGPYPRAVRDIAAATGKRAELEIGGDETQLDRVILEGISEAIVHLLRNAVAHGIEPPAERERAGKPAAGRIQLSAEARGGLVAIQVADDGYGVSEEIRAEADRRGGLVEVLANPGFSTAESVSEVAGRGVGLDAVKTQVESVGGSLELQAEPGRGMRATMLVPLTLALLNVLLVERGDRVYGLPLPSVGEVLSISETVSLAGRRSLDIRGQPVPLADLAAILGAPAPPLPAQPPALIASSSGGRVAAACDRMLGEQEVVVKSLGPLLAGVPGYLGAAILGDGRIALILDPAFLVRGLARVGDAPLEPPAPAAPARRAAPNVLVVDDQLVVRELQRGILAASGYTVQTARDGREALGLLREDSGIELVLTDVQMPGMDGLELVRQIRSDPRHASLPVVIVTTRSSEEDRRLGAEAGADAYIVKEEFDQRALIETVERLIG